jgi:signal transduction histidine kinase
MATFRTRARALDMLGRQQIAGIPTAISELFKNAHDAYADHVEVDYFRRSGLLVLRDDGIGMTRQEFEERWLTLGTESKMGAGVGLALPPRDPNKAKRPTLGEKGIGRLAIGVIGPQTLVLTRAKRDTPQPVVAAFMHWGVFALPGINLEQINIPILEFDAGSLPGRSDIAELIEAFSQSLKPLEAIVGRERLAGIRTDLSGFIVDPRGADSFLGTPSLVLDGHGTHFFILPATETLADDIDSGRNGDDTVSPLIKTLIGFTNTMTPDHLEPRIRAAFRDRKLDDQPEELIGESAFFTPEEFRNADHHIRGRFDEYGQFTGSVAVYGEEYNDYVVPWTDGAGGRSSRCGPFNFNLAYIQGSAKDSTLPPDQWTFMSRKLNQIGGLYIYRDGVRVQPYGDTDFDWLEIEKNRTKSAGYYFFSYRRLFGVVELSSDANAELKEKAGREGFQANAAYREFRAILKNFFTQVAADFFREGAGARAERYQERKEELKRQELARRHREQQVRQKRDAFGKELETFFERLRSGLPEREAVELLQRVERDVGAAVANPDPERATTTLLDAETAATQDLRALRARYRIAKPRGVGLTIALRRDWEAYELESSTLDEHLFSSISAEVGRVVSDAAARADLLVDRRRRIRTAVQQRVDESTRRVQAESRETRRTMEDVRVGVVSVTRASLANVADVVASALADLERTSLGNDEAEAERLQRRLEERIEQALEQEIDVLEAVRSQLAVVLSRGAEEPTAEETLAAVEEEALALKEQAASELELAQLGAAVQVIEHEFDATVAAIREGLRGMQRWAGTNPSFRIAYERVRTSFDHLDAYLTLFTPLNRRLYTTKVDVKGSAIYPFLRNLFGERMRRHGIELQATNQFLHYKMTGFPSTFFPVFVNLLDNAIFWMKGRSGPKLIRLDADNRGFLISDTGPGVNARDRTAIFERGFTRKPGGRGLGLKISRDILKRENFTLELEETSAGAGAMFRISPEVP